MAAVGGATSKPSPAPSNASNGSSSAEKSKNTKKSDQSSSPPSSSSSSSSQGHQTQDSFESGDKKKKKVDISGGDTSTSPVRAEVSQSASTGPAYQRKDEKELAPGTKVKNELTVGQADASFSASGEVNKDGASGKIEGSASATAFENDASLENQVKVTDGDKPLTLDNTVNGSVRGEAEAHFKAEGHANEEEIGGKLEMGASAAVSGELTGRAELNTVDENGEKENLASVEAGVHGHAGPEASLTMGASYKDGQLTTELGMDVSPIVGGGFDVKLGVNVDNIAEQIADLGHQAQQGFGETLSGIQKFLGGISIFG